ncbi:hypothetical protein TraAM80_00307 [Trypanosoma rangeli]|uniref:Transmembrane protein n=1 Tax=Trypanosoma rangeli TaxID=5698 RepID=A0A3S5ISN9_TRYRA|nr:uncharacterized protein TraAM80_00307 [Trypanosoma rangeli]RNF12455.1 hypothetical protein TraAM80_00307 [Trypanosoma rangeli]|eukprot:RNF12455.1 hypothetical protein TraAM80_00307 [Trypanosoma rangeli]
MRPAEGALRYRLLELRARVWYALLPNDRPTPLFTLVSVIVNGAQLTHGFSILVSLPCSALTMQWCALGLSNAIVNMIFAIALMWRMRYRIEQGIPTEWSTLRLFIMDPINITFLFYVAWEILWMVGASWVITTQRLQDACGTYISIQLGCCCVFLIMGCALLLMTFVTELLKRPRWRLRANDMWRRRHPTRGSAPLNLTNILGDDHRTDMGTIPRSTLHHPQEQQEQGEEMAFTGQALSYSSNMVAGNADASAFREWSNPQGNTLFVMENEASPPHGTICFSPRACDQNE